MKIHTLQLRNFRKFEDYTFQFHPNFTVLIGDNASGKSSVLDALAVMLGTYIPKYQEGVVRGGIKKKDARLRIFEKYDQVTLEQQKPTFLNARGTLHGNNLEWKRKLGDRGKDARDLTQIGEMDFTAVSNGEEVYVIPLERPATASSDPILLLIMAVTGIVTITICSRRQK